MTSLNSIICSLYPRPSVAPENPGSDRCGAELLLGRSRLAAKLNGEQGLMFAQAPFLSDQDMEAVVEAIRSESGNGEYEL